ncbi:uncharacterized protein LOC127863727 isoform X3 [Dreissena polymorpha]|uniref:uncharacterized protein LOC127863727 isoform X3 n=1 Tax=Dreissena polymorpha TaxID=45954 RepID=UPI0022648C1F|nr:uncharacterized protein LOC127863727 isoform X3 [Dreissena polymorpha]
MPKDNKDDLCLEDVRTDGSYCNMLVELVFDILSERLWTSPFTNYHVFGQSVMMPMEDRSTTQQYRLIDTTCTGEHVTSEKQTIRTIDATCTGEHISADQQTVRSIDTICTGEHMTADQPTVRTNDSTTSNEDTSLTIERLESRVEEDAQPSYQDYSDINGPDSNDNCVTIYNRRINHELNKAVDKAVDCIDQRAEGALLSISREGREVLKNKQSSVILKDSDKAKKDFLVIHSEIDERQAWLFMKNIKETGNKNNIMPPVTGELLCHIPGGEGTLGSVGAWYDKYRCILVFVTNEFQTDYYKKYHSESVIVWGLDVGGDKLYRVVPVWVDPSRKTCTIPFLKPIGGGIPYPRKMTSSSEEHVLTTLQYFRDKFP